MIKKILGLLLFCLFGLSNVFAYTEITNCYQSPTNCNYSTGTSMSCFEVGNNEEFVSGNFTYKADNNGNVQSYVLNRPDYYKVNFFSYIPSTYSASRYFFTYWGSDHKLHLLYSAYNNGYDLTLDSGGLCIVSSNDIYTIGSQCGFRVNHENCNTNYCTNKYNGDINEFYNTNGGFDKIYFLPGLDSSVPGQFCYTKGNTGYCILRNAGNQKMFQNCNYGTYVESGDFKFNGDTGFQYITGNVSTRFNNSPFDGGNGGITVNFGSGAIELGSDESAINYYEKTYGWDEKICYVGVDNYTDLYGTRVSFQEGSGLSIFEVFSGLYGNTDLDRVYVWLNSWLINYDEFWVKQSLGLDPTRKAIYNSGTNQVDLIYTGLDVSPFINSPVAVYFMSNYIYDRSPYKTMGSQVVSYCNIKINSGTYDEILDEADKNNITDYSEQSNKNIGLNPDGTVNTIDYSQFGYGGGQAFGLSGVDLAFSGDTSVKNTLKNFFDEFDGALSSLDITTNTRILPTWLVTAFLFVVLFKFLRKRS